MISSTCFLAALLFVKLLDNFCCASVNCSVLSSHNLNATAAAVATPAVIPIAGSNIPNPFVADSKDSPIIFAVPILPYSATTSPNFSLPSPSVNFFVNTPAPLMAVVPNPPRITVPNPPPVALITPSSPLTIIVPISTPNLTRSLLITSFDNDSNADLNCACLPAIELRND